MFGSLSSMVGVLLKIGGVALLFNEVRGLILAAPVLWTMWESGGTWMAIWVGFCSLAGIALSVAVPLFAAHRLKRRFACNLLTEPSRQGSSSFARQ